LIVVGYLPGEDENRPGFDVTAGEKRFEGGQQSEGIRGKRLGEGLAAD